MLLSLKVQIYGKDRYSRMARRASIVALGDTTAPDGPDVLDGGDVVEGVGDGSGHTYGMLPPVWTVPF